MKKINSIIWGLVLIAVGVIVSLNALGLADINLFFGGWWTLFLIIPGVIGIFTRKNKTWSFIIALIGVFFLLAAQGIINPQMAGKLIFPAIIVIIGARLIFKGILDGKAEKRKIRTASLRGNLPSYNAIFGGQNVSVSGEVFSGASADAVFGGIEMDLRQAIIEEDCVLELTAIFGGIDILLPEGVNVDIKSTSIFGGISDKRKKTDVDSAPTVYIDGTCMFGGVDVK